MCFCRGEDERGKRLASPTRIERFKLFEKKLIGRKEGLANHAAVVGVRYGGS